MTQHTITYDDAHWQLVPRIITAQMSQDIDAAIGRLESRQVLWNRALAAAPQPDTQKISAQRRYEESCIEQDTPDPLERLRFFCSLAMNADDWLDSGPLFDAVSAVRSEPEAVSRTVPSDEDIERLWRECNGPYCASLVFADNFARALLERYGSRHE
jgi:hypothetical protein